MARFLAQPLDTAVGGGLFFGGASACSMRNPGQPTGGAYHVLDYSFFWANVRHNVAVRVGAFIADVGARPRL